MDPFYLALSLFRRRKYEQCIEVCNQLLISDPNLEGPWELKMRAMTQRVYVDDIEAEEDAVTGSLDCQHFFIFRLFFEQIPSTYLSLVLWSKKKSDCTHILLFSQRGQR